MRLYLLFLLCLITEGQGAAEGNSSAGNLHLVVEQNNQQSVMNDRQETRSNAAISLSIASFAIVCLGLAVVGVVVFRRWRAKRKEKEEKKNQWTREDPNRQKMPIPRRKPSPASPRQFYSTPTTPTTQ